MVADAEDFRGQWADRCVRRGLADPADLLANPRNWRIHPREQGEALEAALDTVGWVGDVIAQEGTDLVIDGHERVALAISREEMVPVAWYDLSDEECDYVLATRDSIGQMAVADTSKLAALMDDVRAPDGPVARMLDAMLHAPGVAPSGGARGRASAQDTAAATDQGDGKPAASIRVVQIFCTQDALDALHADLDAWRGYPGVQRIAIS